jgi:Ca2+-binding RTX toxin-like protein
MRRRFGQALAAIAALGGGLLLAMPEDVSAATCDGRRATHVGTQGADVIATGRGNDVIVSLGGDDQIRSGSGDDRVCAGGGDDQVSTGFGRDSARGAGGADTLHGGSNGDDLRGGPGDDDVFGGILDDRISGDGGADLLIGGHGVDRMLGGAGGDWLRGGTNDDFFDGGSSAGDVASFATAMPPFDGCAGQTSVEGVVVKLPTGAAGGDGCDRLTRIESVMGSAFGDSIAGLGGGSTGGGGGADVCSGFSQEASCNDPGGDSAGTSYVEAWSPGPGSREDPGLVVIDARGGLSSSIQATPPAGAGQLRYAVAYGYGGNDQIGVGTGFAPWAIAHLDGGEGDDSVSGGEGEDVLFSYSGRDSLSGGGGEDALLSLGEPLTGEGDLLDAGDGDDQLVSSFACGGHRFEGGGGVDVAGFARSAARHAVVAALDRTARVRGVAGCAPTAIRGSEILEGTAGPDVLRGDGDSNPYIWGRAGDDRIFGGGGNDRLEGAAGRDRLDGGPGRDGLYGMSGTDLLLARDGLRDAILCRGRDGGGQVRTDRVDPRPRSC